MKWTDDERIMISALEHYAYCPRQCALIHVEQSYEENLYTLRGNRDHERVDTVTHEAHDGIRVERSLPLYSDRLGLVGRADVVEFHGDTPYPIEYKHGTKRYHRPARIRSWTV
ncbi:MAG: CRISPR-associated protein Cas4 [Longimonas sp.]|uniref:CRISPR-associated protein Cas4 n=1 Tax=Longimonas sp. TaxID=2039626 RepID=UPI003351705C